MLKNAPAKTTNLSRTLLIISIALAMSTMNLLSAAEHQQKNMHDTAEADEHKLHTDNDHEQHTDDDHEQHTDNDHEQHTDNEHDEHGDTGLVKISARQQAMAGIEVITIHTKKNINQTVSAPGEIVNDQYHTTLLTTQTDSKVLKRKVVLGQHVEKNEVIAVLYSLAIATTQNELKVALSEWQRVRKLGQQTVGAKRYISARADVEKNKALLLAYGFTEKLLQQFIQGSRKYKAGEYPVLAPHDGVILEDNFQSGQYLSAGSTIAMLVDEDNVWVEALLAPEIGQKIPVGTKARVVVDNKTFTATVIHDSHAIDEITRTRKIRLLIKNKDHLLHAGLFANVFLQLPIGKNLIILPETALMRSSDGDWAVFIEQSSGVFKQQEVELENTINGQHSINGLHAGQRIAVKGAFFLASEMAKGGFDPHNH